MFTRRLKSDLPQSLKHLIDSVLDKKHLIDLNMSHNAFGPQCVKSFESLLETSASLKSLNVTNCGLGPQGGQMIAAAMAKNKNIRLREFYGSRGRLEDEGYNLSVVLCYQLIDNTNSLVVNIPSHYTVS